MDTAWIGLISALIGAAIGGSAAYLGPLHVQRRTHREERRRAEDDRSQQLLAMAGEARTASAMWLRDIFRVMEDLKASADRWTPERFDDVMAPHEREFRTAVSAIIRFGYHMRSGHPGGLTESMRESENILRTAIAEGRTLSPDEDWEIRRYAMKFQERRVELEQLIISQLDHFLLRQAQGASGPESFPGRDTEGR